jgi:hypothetical protein
MLVRGASAKRAVGHRSHPFRRKFTADEDGRLRVLVDRFGRNLWDEIAKLMEGRTPRQCRDRYNNYLIDSINGLPWTPEEDAIVVDQFRIFGHKWAQIARSLPGRNGNQVKNRWNRHLCRFQFDRAPSRAKSIEYPSVVRRDTSAVHLCPLLDIDWGRVFDRIEAAMESDEMGSVEL